MCRIVHTVTAFARLYRNSTHTNSLRFTDLHCAPASPQQPYLWPDKCFFIMVRKEAAMKIHPSIVLDLSQ
jgi:hypothetical protein